MENIEAPEPYETPGYLMKLIESKKYELKYEDDTYTLLVERYSDENIYFKLRKSNNLSLFHFMNKCDYNGITKSFLLQKEYYEDMSKVFQFFDLSLTKNKIKLEFNKVKNTMELKLNKVLDFDEVECKLELNQKKLEKDEMFSILINEINEIKNKKEENKDNKNIINELIKKNKEYENKIKILEDKINILENEIKLFKESQGKSVDEVLKPKEKNIEYNEVIKINNAQNKEKNEVIKPKEDKNELMNQINFKENPQNLKFKYQITNNRSNSGCLQNFDVFIGLKDKIEYIVYNNANNYNLDIMRISDKFIINSLKGHNGGTQVIRYYMRNNKEDYILSCDANKLTIVWDIQNDYNQKYTIKSDYSGNIYDALLLFNYNNKDYIVLSSGKDNEYSKLYEFKNKTPFIKNIYGTNNNKTNYMIPWLYNNKYYIIECCDNKISINNIFEDENYGILSKEPEGCHCCGYIYNDNYLCVSDWDNNYIRIWDLINKSIYKQINYNASYGCEIIPWNNKYAIIGCYECFVIIDIEDGKMIKKIKSNKGGYLQGIKKMKINNLGECLIGSIWGNTIELFSI